PDDALALATVLRSPLGPLSDDALLLLARGPREDGQPARALRRSALADPVALAALAPDDAQAAQQLEALLSRLQRDAQRLGPAALLEEALARTDLLAAYAAGLHGEQAAANVGKLLSLARSLELRGLGLRELVARLRALAGEEVREAEAAV